MKTLNDAMEIRRRLHCAFEMAESAADAEERRQWLTFALVGGGPTGVELAGADQRVPVRHWVWPSGPPPGGKGGP